MHVYWELSCAIYFLSVGIPEPRALSIGGLCHSSSSAYLLNVSRTYIELVR
jgi:hypothetical protein